MAINNQQIRLALQMALLGEVTSSVRAIAFQYDKANKYFRLRYYLDREPVASDYEGLGNVIAEFVSNFKFSEFDLVEEECVFASSPISQLDVMDGMVYCRNETSK